MKPTSSQAPKNLEGMGAMKALAQKPCAIDARKFSVLRSEIEAIEVARKD